MQFSLGDLRRCVDNGELRLIVMPTEACNFRCTYCYEDFHHGRMSKPVVKGIKRLLSRRASSLHKLSLSWFGGEPLLAFDIIEEVMVHAKRLQERRAGMELVSDITTNAYTLTPDRFETLLRLGVRHYQITFDGPAVWHDRKRVRADGRGTFDRIWTHVVSMRRVTVPFEVTLRLHVDRENHAALPEFIESCARSFGGDPRFRLFLRRLERLGGPNDCDLPVFDRASGAGLLQDLASMATRLGLRCTTDTTAICYAAHGNSFVVRADGRINKCTVALEHPQNQVGRLHPNGEVDCDSSKFRLWMRGLWSEVEEELVCPARGLAESWSRSENPVIQVGWRIQESRQKQAAGSCCARDPKTAN